MAIGSGAVEGLVMPRVAEAVAPCLRSSRRPHRFHGRLPGADVAAVTRRQIKEFTRVFC